MRLLLISLGLALAMPVMADDTSAEQMAAAEREQQELKDRAKALAEQLEDAKRLEQLQDAYLEKLKAVVEED